MTETKRFGLNPVVIDRIFKEIDSAPGEKNYVMEAANNSYEQTETAQKEGMVDTLTGCFNQNYFEKFKKENFNPERDDKNLALVFVDINNLKTVNDTQGHEAGDALIKNTAIFLKSSFRKEDTVVRLGGDEFVIICRNHKEEENFGENLFKTVKEQKFIKTPMDFAFGVAVYDKEKDLLSLNGTKNRADKLMYEKKAEMKSGKQK